MGKRQSPAAIASESLELLHLRGKVPRTNAFGDIHHAAIDAQLAVLEKDLSLDDIDFAYGEESDGFAENVHVAAIEAHDWMTGELAEDEGKPSDSWAELGEAR